VGLGRKIRVFPQTRGRKTTNCGYLPGGARASRVGTKQCFLSLFCTFEARSSKPRACGALFQCIFACFFVFFSDFFLETCLQTWHRISSTCNVFRGLFNLYSLSFQFFTRCHVLLNYMIF